LGADLLSHICRTIILSITGSPHCETTVVSIGVDGLIQISVGIDLGIVQNLLVPVYQLTDLTGCIDLHAVDQTVNTIIDTVNSATGVDNIISQMNDQNQIKKDIMSEVCDARPDAETLLKSREDIESAQEAQRDTAMDAIKNEGDTAEAGEIVKQRVIDCKQQELDDYNAALANIKLSAQQAAARVASCTENLCQARLDHTSEPDNADFTQAYEQRCQELKDSLALSLIVKQQCDALQAQLELKIGSGENYLLDIQAQLQLCIDDNLQGVIHSIESLKLKITLKPNDILFLLGDVLKAIFGPECNILDSVWSNLDNALPLQLTLDIEHQIPPEKFDYVTECHRVLVPHAVQLLTGCPVKSCDITSTTQKRDIYVGLALSIVISL